jgi:hypothetical protein
MLAGMQGGKVTLENVSIFEQLKRDKVRKARYLAQLSSLDPDSAEAAGLRAQIDHIDRRLSKWLLGLSTRILRKGNSD